MAVIKIVPMPGAVGDKGDEGAVGPRGLQGEQGLQGAPGADALWTYNGEYNPGAGYAVGDVVTYDGQLWYRKNSNGGNVGDTPSQGLFWDLLAAKGTDGTPLNFWNFTGDPGVPTEDGLLVVDGISGRSETGQGNVSIFAGPTASVVLAGNGGEFLKDTNIPENQIATIGDVESQLNYWDGVETPQDPAQDGFLILDGIVTGLGSSLLVSASDTILISANNGEFLNDATISSNQIATIGDIQEIDTLTNGLVVTGQIDDVVLNPAGTMSLSVQDGYTALMDLIASAATFNGNVYVTNLGGDKTTIIETPTTINNDLTVDGTLNVSTGATGTFQTSDSKIVTVTNGIITSIESLT